MQKRTVGVGWCREERGKRKQERGKRKEKR